MVREVVEIDYAVGDPGSVREWRGTVGGKTGEEVERCSGSGGEVAAAELATKAEDGARRGAAV